METEVQVNDVYYPLLFDESRYLVLLGGAGSGKSFFAAQKIIGRCLDKRHRFLIIRKVSDTLKDSVFSLVTALLGEHGIFTLCDINKTEKTILFPNGSQIIMKGLDDPEKIKSIAGITGIWIEEATEITEADFDQLDLRLRGETICYKQIILTFNPIDERHWLKKRFFDNEMNNCLKLKTTYEDNYFIDDEYREVLEMKSKTSPNFYRVYKLGEWGKAEVKRPFLYNFNYNQHVSKLIAENKILYNSIFNDKYPLRFSLDFNFDPFVCLVLQIWRDAAGHHIHFIRMHELHNCGTNEMIELLKTSYTPSQLANAIFTGDATQRKSSVEQTIKSGQNIHSWEKLNQAFKLGGRLQTPRANPIVRESRDFCNTIFSLHPDLKIDENMTLLINELQFTEADEEGNIMKGNRNNADQRFDAGDALRYALHTWVGDFDKNIKFYIKK